MDCWASKGFTFSRLSVAPGIEIDVYNLHFDAGGSMEDDAVRRSNIKQLLRSVQAASEGRPVIIGGDTNLESGEASDEILLESFRRRGGFRIACREANCRHERKDRFLFRSGDTIRLDVLGWSVPAAFVDDNGYALSDHAPVAVTYRWQLIPYPSSPEPRRSADSG
jgi:endonuclease/exonuclease/phosphatase family metal-dependent hydrolase